MLSHICIAVVLFGAGFAKLFAQDVTVTQPVRFENDGTTGASDGLPALTPNWQPEYPKKLKSGEPGYVIVAQRVTPKGMRDFFRPIGTEESFVASVFAAYCKMYLPLENKIVRPPASYSWFAVIYNPASSTPGKPNATARLVRVAPAVVSLEQWNNLPKNKKLHGTLLIDAKGAVAKITIDSQKSEEQALMPEIEKAVAQWVFEPVRSSGHPVESSMKTSFVFHVKKEDAVGLSKNIELPKRLSLTSPMYPQGLKEKGITGEVRLKWIINERGNVEQASVLHSSAKDSRTEALKKAKPQTIGKSTSKAFEKSALATLKEWQFEPCRIDGHPVKVSMQMPMTFTLNTN